MYTACPCALVQVRVTRCWVLVVEVVKLRPSGNSGPGTVTCRVRAPLSPSVSRTVRRTVYVPAAPYAWLGSRAADVSPSPKLHCQPARLPSGSVLLSANVQLTPPQPARNAGVGAELGPGEGSDTALTFTILPTDGTPFRFTRNSM